MSFRMLLENMFAGDLEGVLKPIISIDDFESKIDEKTIVLAFYCRNEEAAEDVAVFLERSAINKILDTEVSTGTNKDGHYVTFVEIDNSTNDPEILMETIKEVVDVIGILLKPDTTWRIKNMRIFGDKLYHFNKSNLSNLIGKIIK